MRSANIQQVLKNAGSVVVMLILTGWPMVLEFHSEFGELFSREMNCDMAQEKAAASFTVFSLYQHLFSTKKPKFDGVVILYIDQDIPGLQSDRCLARAFMGDVFETLASSKTQHPAVVAVDKFYSATNCQPDARDSNSPLSMGQMAALCTSRSAQQQSAPAEQTLHLLECAQALQLSNPELTLILGRDDFPATTTAKDTCICDVVPLRVPGAKLGFVRLNANPLHVPLRWQVRKKDTADSEELLPEDSFGLAYAAARAKAPRLAADYGIQHMLNSPVEQPYVKVGGIHDMQLVSALEFVCFGGVLPEAETRRWHCPNNNSGVSPQMMDGKVVLIGAKDDSDRQVVLDEPMYGYEVQAMYVADLLGGAYLREWALWLQLLIAVGLVLCVEFPLFLYDLHDRIGWRHIVAMFGGNIKKPVGMPWEIQYIVAVGIVVFSLCIVAAAGWWWGWLPPLSLLGTALLILLAKISLYHSESARQKSKCSEGGA